MQKKVMVVQPIASEGIEMLEKEGFLVDILEDNSVETMKERVVDADAILLRTKELPREVLEQGKKLKVISRHGVGVDNIDVKAATKKGIQVTNGPAANSESVAEHTITLLLALAKNIRIADIAIRRGEFNRRDELGGVEVLNKTLGILGLGNIGRRVAQKAHLGLGMKIIGYDPYLQQKDLKSYVEFTDEWDRIFKEADFISLNLPLTEETQGVVRMREFKLMKRSAYLINCARGSVVNEKDLITALKKKIIAGAGLDVFSQEPPSDDFFQLENTILTPHMAAHTEKALINMASHAAQGIIEVLRGKKPTWPVNKL